MELSIEDGILVAEPLAWTWTEPDVSTAEWRLAALEVRGEGTQTLRSMALCRLAAREDLGVARDISAGGTNAGRSAADRDRLGGLSGIRAMPPTLPTNTEFCEKINNNWLSRPFAQEGRLWC
ncbi:unnamed protein product, partial [Iphiclides podalirius]